MSTLQNIAIVRFYQGRDDEALSLYRRAGDVFEKTLPANHRFRLKTHLHVGIIHLRAGKPDDAVKEIESARAVHKAIGGDLEDQAVIELALAGALYAAGSRERARSLVRQTQGELAGENIAYARGFLADRGVASPPQLANVR